MQSQTRHFNINSFRNKLSFSESAVRLFDNVLILGAESCEIFYLKLQVIKYLGIIIIALNMVLLCMEKLDKFLNK